LPYRILYSPEAEKHLRRLKAGQRAIVVNSVSTQLKYQPSVPTKKRKLMRSNPLAPWELRIGNVRVYYEIVHQPEPKVNIRAIGVKVRNRLFIAGEEVEL
jgi:mRNA-degrading endonuclease RelE of RelBE toxin-antitoxin system